MISPFEFKTTRKILFAFALIAALVGQQETVSAQEEVSAKVAYEAALLKARELAKACRNVSLRFFDSSKADSREWEKKWPDVVKDLADHKPIFEQAAIDWFLECKNPDDELVDIASMVSSRLYEDGQLELTWELLNKIERCYPEEPIMLQLQIALVAAKTNRFERALEFLRNPKAEEAMKELDQIEKNSLLICSIMSTKWQREKQLREEEAKADDLPRVKFELTTGEVIIELYENEAPQTVANFISRVESGFYDGSYCHPHIQGIVMQTGMVNRSHNIPVDYVIENESRKADSRDHFAGCLTMASLERDQGVSSSVFAIMLLANPDLDWDRTEEDDNAQPVFGRVVSGINHVMSLPATMDIDEETQEQKVKRDVTPGFIERATVIRKRDHEYTFEKIRRQKK